MSELPSLWVDMDGFMEAFNGRPEAVRMHAEMATCLRGGLAAVASKAALSRFGMTLADLDRKTGPMMPCREVVEAAHAALKAVARLDPDHAAEANGRGFARSDVTLGHALATATLADIATRPAYAVLVLRLAARYRRQVSPRLTFRCGF